MKGRHMELTLVLVIALLSVAAAAGSHALPGCIETCGDVSIPYPFGVGKNCSLGEAFILNCTDSILYTGNVQVSNISLEGQVDLHSSVSQFCYDSSGVHNNSQRLSTPSFTISRTENEFITVGCNSWGFLDGTKSFSIGCFTQCTSLADMKSMQNDGYCTGVGCCQVDIPFGTNSITVRAEGSTNFSNYLKFNNCSYAFIAKKGFYNFSLGHLTDLPNKTMPMVADWANGDEKCSASQKRATYACKNNSFCHDTNTSSGYLCICKPGYEGNAYHPDGCQDINECMTPHHTCISDQNCRNTEGSHYCVCLKGQFGNATKEGGGCQQMRRENLLTKITIGTCVGLMALILATSSVYIMYQKRKLIKLREKFFRQNGGVILQQELSRREDSSQTAQIFTAEQLKKATNNYDESLIIGSGGYGTVFKGVFTDNRVVAVKKSKVVDQSQVEQFINEVVVLSQINHRNVVKLLGCCLETEVPLLVYEFVNNGTLFDYLHKERRDANVSWKTRLRIASEAAGALSYLHSSASIPIIHRDIKSANILLDDTYTARVSDFGASRLVPLDQTELATMVQGTIGYLDPEYMQTSQLTEKSDVYSFGVVLIELLTGEKALSFERPEEKRSLAMHFLSCLKEDLLFDILDVGILNNENKDEIKEVAILAANCLRLTGEERPSMKEVEMELEAIRQKDKHPWTNTNQNFEETQHLLHEASSDFVHGDSSNHQNTGYDSLRDHVLIAFDDGR